MNPRLVISSAAIFFVWSILDMLIHGYCLMDLYVQTAHLWRPEAQMKPEFIYAVTIIFSVCFVAIYHCFVSNKSLSAGIKLGVLFGIISGSSMGFGTYAYTPIPFELAVYWFLTGFGKTLAAGAIVGALVKK